jgi:hypothetical protein
MIATRSLTHKRKSRPPLDRDKLTLAKQYSVVDTGRQREVITARLYHKPGGYTWRALVWTTEDHGDPGRGKAGGGGYHKPSAALAEAIRDLGYQLDQDIDGRGDAACEAALLALARLHQGDTARLMVITAHA